MDNQKDQSGTTPDQNNASRPTNTPTPAPTASGASAASRKSAPMPDASQSASNPTAQDKSATPNAQSQTTANAGAERQGEGQQTNAESGTILDTALNSGKKWIEDSGMLDGMNQMPQSIKDLGNRAVAKVKDLTTTQKVVGGALLAVGLGWLATRKGKSSSSDSDSSSYNYGRQRDAGSYGRRTAGYQAPDASPSRGTTARASDSGSPYGGSGRYGSSDKSASGSGSGASAKTDHGSQAGQHDNFRTIE